MDSDETPIIELYGEDVRHCTAPFSESQVNDFTNLETLPYGKLGGQGFERLIFELLVAQGYTPRFFGRSGQAQPEVDIVATKDGKTDVFSCKNLAEKISLEKLQERLDRFEQKWLKQEGLPKPDSFIICWSQSFRDSPIEKEWNKAKEVFYRRTGVQADIWHLENFDSWLKKRPDIVADLFSDRHAHNFCDPDLAWNQDLFVPLRKGASGDPRLKLYFDYRNCGKLYLDPDYEQAITDALENFNVILLRGLPGTGKTLTGLAVAVGFRNSQCRTYFLDVSRDEFNTTQLKAGIRRRLSRTSLFLLENTHLKPDVIEHALRDLDSELKQGKVKIICLARRVPGTDPSRNDDSDYFEELEVQGAVVEFDNNDKRLRQIIEFWQPTFKGISRKRLVKLCAVCGRDLYLLNEVLFNMESPVEIDTLTPAGMYDQVRHRYFAGKTADDLANIRRLAALAQFDLKPLATVLKLEEKELQLIQSLTVKAGTPPRWYFLHSSAAELVLHALWSGVGETDQETIADYAAEDVVEYFRELQNDRLRPKPSVLALEADWVAIVRNQLKLMSDEAQNRLKSSIMDSEPLQSLILKLVASPKYAKTIWICLNRILRLTSITSQSFYVLLLHKMIENLLKTSDSQSWAVSMGVFGLCLRTLKIAAPSLYAQLAQDMKAEHVLTMLVSGGTIPDLFGIVNFTSPEFASQLIDALDEARVAKLIQQTIVVKRSIGTLDLTLFELRKTEETKVLGEALERKIGPVPFLELIEANGTVLELFGIIQRTSQVFARQLIETLDEARVAKLIRQTIAAKRSIGTLDLTLFELRKSEETQVLGRDLERKIGPLRFLELIEGNGTVFELFMLVKHASPEFASQLIEALDEVRVAKLIQQTIAAKRSIGTLHLALFELRKNEETKVLGEALERKIGSVRFLDLIESNGTILELFNIVKYSSPEFARQLIEALDETRVAKLIQQTISAKRSIGTLNFTLRGLRLNPDTKSLADDLEQKIGIAGFWVLLVGTGSPGPLVDLARDMGQDFRQQFILAAHRLSQHDWAKLLLRGDLFQLVELLQECVEIFDEQAGGSLLLAAIETEVSSLAASSNWYALNTSHKRLAESLASTARDAVENALDAWLAQVNVDSLSFPSLHEAVDGIALLSARQTESLPLLARRFWKLLPSSQYWKLDPKKDMWLPRLLLRLVSHPAFADADAEKVKAELARCLTPQIVAKCRTVDILWTSWAFIAIDANRSTSKTSQWGRGFPVSLKTSVIAALEKRAAETAHLEELRARFALLGLLSLMDAAPTCQRASGLYSRHPNLRNLIQDQTFIMAFFIAKGIALVEPRQTIFTPYLCRDLLGRASLYPQLDQATEWLRQDILNP